LPVELSRVDLVEPPATVAVLVAAGLLAVVTWATVAGRRVEVAFRDRRRRGHRAHVPLYPPDPRGQGCDPIVLTAKTVSSLLTSTIASNPSDFTMWASSGALSSTLVCTRSTARHPGECGRADLPGDVASQQRLGLSVDGVAALSGIARWHRLNAGPGAAELDEEVALDVGRAAVVDAIMRRLRESRSGSC
jgi:hypothetical protein